MTYKSLKLIIDFLFALLSISVLFPLFILVILLIKLDSKGPVFYTQPRLGHDKKVFRLYKFRTMTHIIREQHHQVFEGDPEVTAVGKLLRRTKIDELPQLINIVRGEMSIVGPRPSLPELISKFNEDAFYRLKVRPGLTGWAQVNGNIFLEWPERWKFDRYYVENISLSLDLRIIFRTFAIVILGEKRYFKSKL